MSRIAKAPLELPKGVEFNLSGEQVRVKGPKGNLETKLHPNVRIEQDNDTLEFKPQSASDTPMAGRIATSQPEVSTHTRRLSKNRSRSIPPANRTPAWRASLRI